MNQIVYWSTLLDWKNQTLTPNPNSIYLMPFFDTAAVGPIVRRDPAGRRRLDHRHADGLLADRVRGRRPGRRRQGRGRQISDSPARLRPAGARWLFRVPVGHLPGLWPVALGPEGRRRRLAKAVEYGKRIKLYPLCQAGNPPATTFVDAAGKMFDATIPYDVRFFESLDRMVQSQPWIERDRLAINMLRSIGIEKGKPFAPDAATKDILTAAMQEARAFFDQYYESYPPYYEGKRWFLPYDPQLQDALSGSYLNGDIYPMDGRAVLYYAAFSSVKHPGAGQFYLFNYPRRERRSAGWQRDLPAPRAAECAGAAVLVGGALRFRDALPDPRRRARRPRLGHPRTQDQRRRLGRPLFRPRGPGRERRQLDPDQSRGPVRGALPFLRPGEAALRQDVGAARHREDLTITGERITWQHER